MSARLRATLRSARRAPRIFAFAHAAALVVATATGPMLVGCAKPMAPLDVRQAVRTDAAGLLPVFDVPADALNLKWLALTSSGKPAEPSAASVVHISFELVATGWEALDDAAGGPPAAAASLQVRDDIAKALLPTAVVNAVPADGPWRRMEGPKYELRSRVTPPFRVESGLRLGSTLYLTAYRR